MSEHPNVARLREGYEAFGKGDFAFLDDLFAEDIRWTVPGRSQLAGTYEGRRAVYDMFARLFELTEGSFRVEPRTILADDTDGVVVSTTTAHRGQRSIEVVSVQFSRLRDGRVVEFGEASTDQYAVDELIG
ncbi:nuclear transport factor 2 family protein [Blastococcus sp. SYSU D00695]